MDVSWWRKQTSCSRYHPSSHCSQMGWHDQDHDLGTVPTASPCVSVGHQVSPPWCWSLVLTPIGHLACGNHSTSWSSSNLQWISSFFWHQREYILPIHICPWHLINISLSKEKALMKKMYKYITQNVCLMALFIECFTCLVTD